MAEAFFEELILQRRKVVEHFKKKISGKKLILLGQGDLAEQTIKLVGDVSLEHRFYYDGKTDEFIPCAMDSEHCNSLDQLIKGSDGRIAVLIAQENFF